MQKIHLIEDDAVFRRTLGRTLSSAGFAVGESATGRDGIEKALGDLPELIILDMKLPGMKGLEVCQALKQEVSTAGIPILILTGSDSDGQEVACLDMGADDYLLKPIKAERLLAHCRALMRRPKSAPHREIELGAMKLSYERRSIKYKGQEITHFTPKEFDVLYELAGRSPDPLDRVGLYKTVWGMDPPSEGSLKTVDVHIRRIRLKMGWKSEEWLVTITGRGYTLAPPRR